MPSRQSGILIANFISLPNLNQTKVFRFFWQIAEIADRFSQICPNFRPSTLYFIFQGELIMPSRQNGILIANYSLVLQHVRLNDAGHYSCQAENYIGATESNKHELMIKCTYAQYSLDCKKWWF